MNPLLLAAFVTAASTTFLGNVIPVYLSVGGLDVTPTMYAALNAIQHVSTLCVLIVLAVRPVDAIGPALCIQGAGLICIGVWPSLAAVLCVVPLICGAATVALVAQQSQLHAGAGSTDNAAQTHASTHYRMTQAVAAMLTPLFATHVIAPTLGYPAAFLMAGVCALAVASVVTQKIPAAPSVPAVRRRSWHWETAPALRAWRSLIVRQTLLDVLAMEVPSMVSGALMVSRLGMELHAASALLALLPSLGALAAIPVMAMLARPLAQCRPLLAASLLYAAMAVSRLLLGACAGSLPFSAALYGAHMVLAKTAAVPHGMALAGVCRRVDADRAALLPACIACEKLGSAVLRAIGSLFVTALLQCGVSVVNVLMLSGVASLVAVANSWTRITSAPMAHAS